MGSYILAIYLPTRAQPLLNDGDVMSVWSTTLDRSAHWCQHEWRPALAPLQPQQLPAKTRYES